MERSDVPSSDRSPCQPPAPPHAARGLREATQRDYIRFVQTFAAFLGRSPETATADDLQRFQVHQTETGVQPPTINCSVSALRFPVTVTLDRQDLSRRLVLARYPRKLLEALSVDEVGQLLQAAPKRSGLGCSPSSSWKSAPGMLQQKCRLRLELAGAQGPVELLLGSVAFDDDHAVSHLYRLEEAERCSR